jgi:hypothetical protein
MTENEYELLTEFATLPLYDESSPSCDLIDKPTRERADGALVTALWEATTLELANEYLRNSHLLPKGGIRYFDGEGKNPNIFAYFWEVK